METDGAQVIDINMDDAMLESKKSGNISELCCFGTRDFARADNDWFLKMGSDWGRTEMCSGQMYCQFDKFKGRRKDFLLKARKIRAYGAATVVMAFDERSGW